MEECYRLAGVLGVGVSGMTLRALRWMAEAHERAWRERWLSLRLLMFGQVKDVQAFLDRGLCETPAPLPPPPDIAAAVDRHVEAIKKNGGRFVMPDDIDKVLANGST